MIDMTELSLLPTLNWSVTRPNWPNSVYGEHIQDTSAVVAIITQGDICANIANYLGASDLQACSYVCRAWLAVILPIPRENRKKPWVGSLKDLKYTHEHGCAWNTDVNSSIAASTRLRSLKYVHEHGCPWGLNASSSSSDVTEATHPKQTNKNTKKSRASRRVEKRIRHNLYELKKYRYVSRRRRRRQKNFKKSIRRG